MNDYAADLQEQIAAAQTSIDTSNNYTIHISIKSPVDGWVKSVVLDEDDDIEDATGNYGYVALVASEKREIINAAGSSLAEGDNVKVKYKGYTYSGTVTNENGAKMGADTAVYDTSGKKLFTGKIELAAFKAIESSSGTITDVLFSENESIDQGETIYRASQYSVDVQVLYENLDDLKDQYEMIQKLIEAGQITSSGTGVVSAVNISEGSTAEEGISLVTVDSTEEWQATVSVDELDINSIEIGQNVNIELDSMPDEVFEGIVTGISDYGSASGGITTYSVTVSVDDEDRFKVNMTLTCEILAKEATDAILVPVDDVISTGKASYVMMKTDRSESEIAAIKQLILDKDYDALTQYMGNDASGLGITMLEDPSQLLYSEVRAVETGIESAYYFQITSGLSEGEQILAQESSDSETEGMWFMQGMSQMQGGMDGTMQGGPRPQGGDRMPGGK